MDIDVGDRSDKAHRRTVHEDIESAKRGDSFAYGSRDGFGVSTVGLDGNCATSRLLDGYGHFPGLVHSVLVGESYDSAALRQCHRDSGTAPPRASRDQYPLPAQLAHDPD